MKRPYQCITLLLSFLITVSCFGQLTEPIEPLVVNFTPEKIKAGGIRSVTVYAELAGEAEDESLATSGKIAEGEFDENGNLIYYSSGCNSELSSALTEEDECLLNYSTYDEKGRKIQVYEEESYFQKETHFHYNEADKLVEIITWDNDTKKAHVQFEWSGSKMIGSKVLLPADVNMQFDEQGRFISSQYETYYSIVSYKESGDTLRMTYKVNDGDKLILDAEITTLTSSNRLLNNKTNMLEMPGMNDETIANYDAQGNAVEYIIRVEKEDLFSKEPANWEIENTYNAEGLLIKRVFYDRLTGERMHLKTEVFTYDKTPLKEKRPKGYPEEYHQKKLGMDELKDESDDSGE